MTRLAEFHRRATEELSAEDPDLFLLLEREMSRQRSTLAMVAACSTAPPSVLACAGSALANVTTEGYPGGRFHAGCDVVDAVERLAVTRAREAFGASYANVQPHSGSSANLAVLFSLLRPGDTVLGMDLDAGGHLTHGSPASVVGRYFTAVGYGVGPDGHVNLHEVAELARRHRPKMIICGASSYPRVVDFAGFRRIADEVGCWLMADISHVAGLVVAGEHPSPVPHAHVTTTSTYKQLYGPRGGLILSGPDADRPGPGTNATLAGTLQRAVFPRAQGTPDLAAVAAKARAFAALATPGFRALARRVRLDAAALAVELQDRGQNLITGGTDNHLVMIDVGAKGYTGVVIEQALEECGIIVNKNRIVGDRKSARVTSGIRLGTNTLALRGMEPADMAVCAELYCQAVGAVDQLDDVNYRLDPVTRDEIRVTVNGLCETFPLPGYDY
ncbi:serine hydroxymethyltransferase [Rhizohabitans arisaemae]|uniref:serine hydroxymethyltransferase n=1 Tax=Rhizohabitans arisaemae TaxID=2720610 RepID=UPI0024B19F42|nr:serine hydroxymethyltransferase [Rhizohabitans arisaemae]